MPVGQIVILSSFQSDLKIHKAFFVHLCFYALSLKPVFPDNMWKFSVDDLIITKRKVALLKKKIPEKNLNLFFKGSTNS